MDYISKEYGLSGDELEFATLLFNYVTEHTDEKCGHAVKHGDTTTEWFEREKYNKICKAIAAKSPDANKYVEMFPYNEITENKWRQNLLRFICENC